MKSTSKKGAKAPASSNVFDIGDNPKFKEKRQWIENANGNQERFIYTANRNIFGFATGDWLICRHYHNEELSPSAVVVCERGDGTMFIATYATADHIKAVVVAFRREVAQ